MPYMLMQMFGVSLGMTLLIELPGAYALGARTRRGLLVVFLANVLTNPAVVLANWLGGMYAPSVWGFGCEAISELAAFAVEAWVYISFAKGKAAELPRPVLLAAVLNALSWGCGIAWNYFG